MAGEPLITVVGNLVADPEPRVSQAGKSWVTFRIASTPRVRDRQSGDWTDGEPLFLGCRAFGDYADNIVQSLTKGTRVIVQGRLVQRSYETREGEKRTVVELQVDEIGPSLRYATAKVTRAQRSGGGGFGGGGGGFNGGGQGNAGGFSSSGGGQSNDDPWATAGPASSGGAFSDDPPF